MHEQSTIRLPIVQSEPGSATKFVPISSLYGILMCKKNQRACPLGFCKSKSYNIISVYTQLRSSVVSNVLHCHRIFLHTLRTTADILSIIINWWYKLVTMPENRYPKKLFSQDWNIKPHRGRQRKVWSRIINDLFVSLELV